MIVVSDATPIISLAKIGMLDILGSFFNEVLLPNAVFDEVCCNPNFASEAEAIQNCGHIRIESLCNEQPVRILRAAGLGLGESEAIALADSLVGSLLLIDERKGRQIALSMGIQVTGTLGILLQAKKHGLINEIKPYLDALLKENIRISDILYNSMLEQAGEL